MTGTPNHGFRLGVDIGGTFTDFALYDDRSRVLRIHKRLTTPHDPSVAVLEGVAAILDQAGVSAKDLAVVAHGTTLVTNAVIERKGARTGMLVTAGFQDLPDMRQESRYDVFDLRIRFPAPLVPRAMRREVDERIHFDGAIARPLDTAAVLQAVRELVDLHKIEALAICFLHAYANPSHEEEARKSVAKAFPNLYVSVSSAVCPQMREFERWTTTTMNAYAQPMFDRYLERLTHGLAKLGCDGRVFVMTSSGGVLSPDLSRMFPVRLLESGPAAGVLMSSYHGRTLGEPQILSFDMGGTTAKGALVRGFQPIRRLDMEVARIHEYKRGSGLPVRIPVIDMVEIGTGGGSVAQVDERGVIRVGPHSAGADPGPACYRRGGTLPTLTDANLLLGYLDPRFFLGGEMALDPSAAWAAIETLARRLGLDTVRTAWGIHETANEDMSRAFRVHASERGFDYRTACVVAFGGCGPIHALGLARKLRVPRVLFPVGAGVMSALGLLVSPLSFETSRSDRVQLSALDAQAFASACRSVIDEAVGFLRRGGLDPQDILVSLLLDMRYQGQGHEIDVRLPAASDTTAAFPELRRMFERRYEELYGSAPLDEPIEIINWRVEARGPDTTLNRGYELLVSGVAETARKGSRQVYLPSAGGLADVPVFDRYGLRAGNEIVGPAVIEERESTCLVGEGDSVRVDEHGNLIARLDHAQATEG